MSERVRRRVIVRGHVQGVWFRESTRQEAEKVGVTGWVRNLPDDTVEAALEGDPEAVEQVLAFVRVGPAAADVTSIDIRHETVVHEVAFEVRPTPAAD
ncbi:MAG TPA: acylphosphatase [Miltoncostaeales bacterium]|nr:acylphosphatase [Miltoncostaeales bacterium]